jgi:hypothetical protein
VPTAALYAGTLLPSSPPALPEIEAGSRDYLRGVARRSRKKVTVATRVDVGYAAETIRGSLQTGAGLIALCVHGRPGLSAGSGAASQIRLSGTQTGRVCVSRFST